MWVQGFTTSASRPCTQADLKLEWSNIQDAYWALPSVPQAGHFREVSSITPENTYFFFLFPPRYVLACSAKVGVMQGQEEHLLCFFQNI